MEIVLKIISESWLVFVQMAPYLLFGFLIAGILSVYISSEWVEKHLGGKGLSPVFKASLFGIPLPLCSCGVIPVAASFNRHGASKAATTSFLLSTPQTGVDSVLVTWSLLGPVFAIFRPITALITGILGGGIVKWFDDNEHQEEKIDDKEIVCTDECCESANKTSSILRIIKYGFHTLPQDIGPALIIGILIAGIISVFIPPDTLTPYIGGGLFSIIILVAAGIPVYVCATASVPIAAAFMHLGASPGAALAFLIAGPATNAAAFTTIAKVMGKKTAVIYLITAGFSAVFAGLLLNWLMPILDFSIFQINEHNHVHESVTFFAQVSAVVLLFILFFAIITKKFNIIFSKGKDRDKIMTDDIKTIKLKVKGMTCNHCVMAVKKTLEEGSGVNSAEVNLSDGIAIAQGDEMNEQDLISLIEKSGYSAKVI